MVEVKVATSKRNLAETRLFMLNIWFDVHGNWINKTRKLINQGEVDLALERIKEARETRSKKY